MGALLEDPSVAGILLLATDLGGILGNEGVGGQVLVGLQAPCMEGRACGAQSQQVPLEAGGSPSPLVSGRAI